MFKCNFISTRDASFNKVHVQLNVKLYFLVKKWFEGVTMKEHNENSEKIKKGGGCLLALLLPD